MSIKDFIKQKLSESITTKEDKIKKMGLKPLNPGGKHYGFFIDKDYKEFRWDDKKNDFEFIPPAMAYWIVKKENGKVENHTSKHRIVNFLGKDEIVILSPTQQEAKSILDDYKTGKIKPQKNPEFFRTLETLYRPGKEGIDYRNVG